MVPGNQVLTNAMAENIGPKDRPAVAYSLKSTLVRVRCRTTNKTARNTATPP